MTTHPAWAMDEGVEERKDNTVEALEELLLEKEARIVALEKQKQRQNEEMTMLRSEVGSAKIKHKEEIYWMRLECDSLRRDREGVEDRIAELHRDLRELDCFSENVVEAQPASIDAAYVRHLQTQLKKSLQTMGVLDNQITMIKASCDDVVKSLKEEIEDVMDDKCRMEMELMNQLAVLDSDKRDLELDVEEKLRAKTDIISDLKQQIASANTNDGQRGPPLADQQVLVEQIQDLEETNQKLKDKLHKVKSESNVTLTRLEGANAELERQIDSMKSDLQVMREGAAAADAVHVLETLSLDRQETLTTLETVALIWEKADDSIQGLEDVMDQLRPDEDYGDDIHGDRERLLSTLETASLVHGQIKVALLLVELKLRNQLNSLKNDKIRSMSFSNNAIISLDQDLTDQMKEIQLEAIAALHQVEESLTDQIRELEDGAAREQSTSQTQKLLHERTRELKTVQSENRKLQDEISRLHREQEQKMQNSGRKDKSEMGISKEVLVRLQNEVLLVVQRIKAKNETIGLLTATVEEQKVREAALKKEMKRMLRRH